MGHFDCCLVCLNAICLWNNTICNDCFKQVQIQSCKKKYRTPCPLIAGVTPFGWNNFLSDMLLVAVYQCDMGLKKVCPTPQWIHVSALRCLRDFLPVSSSHTASLWGVNIWALSWPLQDSPFLCIPSVLSRFAGMFRHCHVTGSSSASA